MFYRINEIIEINLQLLFLSKNQSLTFSEFKDKNGDKIEKLTELFQFMEKKQLIKIENNSCILTPFGQEIVKNGGWFDYLKKKKEDEKIKAEESQKIKHFKKKNTKTKSFFIPKKSFSILTKHFKNILKRRKT